MGPMYDSDLATRDGSRTGPRLHEGLACAASGSRRGPNPAASPILRPASPASGTAALHRNWNGPQPRSKSAERAAKMREIGLHALANAAALESPHPADLVVDWERSFLACKDYRWALHFRAPLIKLLQVKLDGSIANPRCLELLERQRSLATNTRPVDDHLKTIAAYWGWCLEASLSPWPICAMRVLLWVTECLIPELNDRRRPVTRATVSRYIKHLEWARKTTTSIFRYGFFWDIVETPLLEQKTLSSLLIDLPMHSAPHYIPRPPPGIRRQHQLRLDQRRETKRRSWAQTLQSSDPSYPLSTDRKRFWESIRSSVLAGTSATVTLKEPSTRESPEVAIINDRANSPVTHPKSAPSSSPRRLKKSDSESGGSVARGLTVDPANSCTVFEGPEVTYEFSEPEAGPPQKSEEFSDSSVDKTQSPAFWHTSRYRCRSPRATSTHPYNGGSTPRSVPTATARRRAFSATSCLDAQSTSMTDLPVRTSDNAKPVISRAASQPVVCEGRNGQETSRPNAKADICRPTATNDTAPKTGKAASAQHQVRSPRAVEDISEGLDVADSDTERQESRPPKRRRMPRKAATGTHHAQRSSDNPDFFRLRPKPDLGPARSGKDLPPSPSGSASTPSYASEFDPGIGPSANAVHPAAITPIDERPCEPSPRSGSSSYSPVTLHSTAVRDTALTLGNYVSDDADQGNPPPIIPQRNAPTRSWLFQQPPSRKSDTDAVAVYDRVTPEPDVLEMQDDLGFLRLPDWAVGIVAPPDRLLLQDYGATSSRDRSYDSLRETSLGSSSREVTVDEHPRPWWADIINYAERDNTAGYQPSLDRFNDLPFRIPPWAMPFLLPYPLSPATSEAPSTRNATEIDELKPLVATSRKLLPRASLQPIDEPSQAYKLVEMAQSLSWLAANRSSAIRALAGQDGSSANALCHGAWARQLAMAHPDEARYLAVVFSRYQLFCSSANVPLWPIEPIRASLFFLASSEHANSAEHCRLDDKEDLVDALETVREATVHLFLGGGFWPYTYSTIKNHPAVLSFLAPDAPGTAACSGLGTWDNEAAGEARRAWERRLTSRALPMGYADGL